jgi:hypothetical protein
MAIPVITPIANQASMTNARALVADIYGHLPSSRRDHRPTRWMRRRTPRVAAVSRWL